jgi:hypothetical protein
LVQEQSFYFGKLTHPKMSVKEKETKKVLVPEHMPGSSGVTEHNQIVKVLKHGNKINTKPTKSKKKSKGQKHSVFVNMKNDDPRSIKLANHLGC